MAMANRQWRALEAGEALSQNTWQELGELSQVDGHILKLPPELLFDVFQVNMIKKLKVGHFVEQRHMIKDGGYCDRMDPVIRSELETRDDPKDVARIITYYEDRRQREAEWARKKAELNGSTADSL